MSGQIKLPIRVTWKTPLDQDWKQTFYPSLVEKILKSDSHFKEIFETKIIDASEKNFIELFYPLYEKEVVNRPDYIFEKDEQKNKILEKIRSKIPYKIFCVWHKESGQYVGGTLFSIRQTSISIALRAFNRSTRKEYKFRTTVDYWAESIFMKIISRMSSGYVTHGSDEHPLKKIGLPLFKMSIGARPAISTNKKSKKYLKESFLQESQLLYFDNPNQENFYQSVHLFYKDDEANQNVVNSLKPVLEWRKLNLIVQN